MAKKKPQPANPWPARLKRWQDRLDLSNDEMARLVKVPSRTWISWKYGEVQPSRTAQTLIELLMSQK